MTEAAGAAYVAFQTAEVARIERELPKPPAGPAQLFMSVDGAHIPVVGGEWAEVKTLVIGVVQPPAVIKGETVIRTAEHSYFSRLTDSDTFQRLALVETQRRGVETASAVGFVTDGAEWLQNLLISIGPMPCASWTFRMLGSTWRPWAKPAWVRASCGPELARDAAARTQAQRSRPSCG